MFKDIYKKVDELKEYNVYELINLFKIRIIQCDIDNKGLFINSSSPTMLVSFKISDSERDLVVLHELGHYLFDRKSFLCNQRTNENNANTFMCLYLIKNEIYDYSYFDKYLIDFGVNPVIARNFNDMVNQYKMQVKYEFAY